VDGNIEDEELVSEPPPVDDDEPEFLSIITIATSSTPDIAHVEPMDRDFEMET
jgi:hypothetical protein